MKRSRLVGLILGLATAGVVSAFGPGLFFSSGDDRWPIRVAYWSLLQLDTVLALALRPVLVSIPFASLVVFASGDRGTPLWRSPRSWSRSLAVLRLSVLFAASFAVCLMVSAWLGARDELIRVAARALLGDSDDIESSGWSYVRARVEGMVSMHLGFVLFATWKAGRAPRLSNVQQGSSPSVEASIPGDAVADGVGLGGRVLTLSAACLATVGCFALSSRGAVLFTAIEDDLACEDRSIFVVLNPLRDRSVERAATEPLAARRAGNTTVVSQSLSSIASSVQRERVEAKLGRMAPRGWRICGLEEGAASAEVCVEVLETAASDSAGSCAREYISLRRGDAGWRIVAWSMFE